MWIKPVVTASIAGLYTIMRYPSAKVKIMGTMLPVYVASFAAVGLGSLVSEILHMYAFPHIPDSDKWSEPVSAVTSAGVAGASTVGVYSLLAPGSAAQYGVWNMAGLGLAAEVVGSYVTEKFIAPLMS